MALYCALILGDRDAGAAEDDLGGHRRESTERERSKLREQSSNWPGKAVRGGYWLLAAGRALELIESV